MNPHACRSLLQHKVISLIANNRDPHPAGCFEWREDGLLECGLGEDTARSLGVPVTRTLRLAALGTAFAVGTGAAVAGSIGFIGLVVPHLLRPWFGERPGALLPAAPLAGAALLLGADMLVRLAPMLLPLSAAPPVGVLTALLGAPFLVAIARRAAP